MLTSEVLIINHRISITWFWRIEMQIPGSQSGLLDSLGVVTQKSAYWMAILVPLKYETYCSRGWERYETKFGYNINTPLEALRHSQNATEDSVEQKASKLRLEWQEGISLQSKIGGEQKAEDQNEQRIWAQILMVYVGTKKQWTLTRSQV